MDEFAQSRADDDLFDDDFIPIESTDEDTAPTRLAHQIKDISLENVPKGPAADIHYQRGNDQRGDRGRGRGGRGRGVERVSSRQHQNSTLLQSKYAPLQVQSDPAPAPAAVTPTPPTTNPSTTAKPAEGELQSTPETVTGSTEAQQNPTPTLSTDPSTPARPPAVRGDRTATGGIKKPKLTEEELTAKLAAAKTRSENLSAAHARAEADAANFAERERAAAQKRVKDAANRKVMEGERERNRARKMAVMGGREWDAAKNEEDFKVASRGRAGAQYHRGANGGLRTGGGESFDDDLSQYQWKEDRGGDRGRGRGRGRRGGRGVERGIGGGRPDRRDGGSGQADVIADADFPSLPATTARRAEPNRSGSQVVSPTAGAASWADQVEVSEATKAKDGR
jgi:hypothetical protein